MKKIFLVFSTLAYFVIAVECCAQTATRDEAALVAQVYLERDMNRSVGNAMRINTEVDSTGNPVFYEVVYQDGTMVLVSGHKACYPVLGIYKGDRGILETEHLPGGLAVMMDCYRQAITYCIDHNARTDNNDVWQSMLSGMTNEPSRYGIEPLLTTKWGQSLSNDSTEQYAYNKVITTIPGSNCPGGHYLAGCVAVAMGQVMNYYKHPVVTYELNDFSEQFDWCHMPDVLVRTSPLFMHECNAVSSLLKWCGEAADMQYYCDRSQTTDDKALYALVRYFHYSGQAKLIKLNHSMQLFSDSLYRFLDTVRMSLNEKCPVIMGARERNGKLHTFVCDGYNRNDDRFHYHFNWGNNGRYDGFFVFNWLGNIEVGDYVFNRKFDAIVFLRPETNAYIEDICDNTMHLEDFYDEYYNGRLPATFPPYEHAPMTMSALYSSDISQDASWRTIPCTAYGIHASTYKAYKDIYLQDGFFAEYGCDFTAMIDPCQSCEETDLMIDQSDDSRFTRESDIMYHISTQHEDIQHSSIYPNPTDGKLTVLVDGEVEAVVILDVNGNPQGGWDFDAITDEWVTLNVRRLKAGAYLLLVRHTDGRTESTKFIKQ